MRRVVREIEKESCQQCQTEDMLRFLFALCCSSGASTIKPVDEQMDVALQKVRELSEEHPVLGDHLDS